MKEVIIHALLAVFGLGFAYQTWARKPEAVTAPGSVEVAECSVDALQKLSLDTPTLEVLVEPKRESGSETKFWITTRHRSPAEVNKLKAAKDPKAADAGAAPAEPQLVEEGQEPKDDSAGKEGKDKEVPEAQRPKRFLANAAFGEYLKRLTPLRAKRSLGKLEAGKDADFGFDKGDKGDTTLGLECAGKVLSFAAGARAFGASQRYVRDTKSQTTYLFEDQVVADLESAQFKFMQAELHDWKSEDVEEASIVAQGATKRLLHRDRKAAETQQWVDEKAPAKRNELYNNWFSRVARLRARAYLATGGEPGSDLKSAASGTAPVLTIDYKIADKPAAKLEVVRVDENNLGHYYARTETTRGWVSLFDSAAKEVEQDVGMVVGVVEQPANYKPAADSGKSAPSAHGGMPMGHPQIPGGH